MAAILQVVIVGIAHALNHGHEDNVVGRIDPEPHPGGGVPEERALSVRQTGFGQIKDNRAVEAIAKACSQDVLPDTEFSGRRLGGR